MVGFFLLSPNLSLFFSTSLSFTFHISLMFFVFFTYLTYHTSSALFISLISFACSAFSAFSACFAFLMFFISLLFLASFIFSIFHASLTILLLSYISLSFRPLSNSPYFSSCVVMKLPVVVQKREKTISKIY